jgi:Xaa-Pro dipeptidase
MDRSRYTDFPEEEYKDRLRKAHEVLRARDLDALFLTEWENIYWMSGYQCAALTIVRDLPHGIIVTGDTDPTLMVYNRAFEPLARETTWIPNIRSCNRLSDVDEWFKKAFADLGLKGAKVGAELGYAQAVKFSTGIFMDLFKNAGPNFVDGGKAIWDLRMTKSKLEVERIRQASRIASRAAERAFKKIRAGMTEEEFARLVAKYVMDEGADRPSFTNVTSGDKLDSGVDSGSFASVRKFKKGDYVQLDWGAIYRHYTSDLFRMGIIGAKPTTAAKDHWNLYKEAYKRGTKAVKPGATAADLYTAMANVFEEAGIRNFEAWSFGHGVGLDVHEFPLLLPTDKTIIKPGMVLSIEPAAVPNKGGQYGTFGIEDNVVCTETGVEKLSTISQEIF